jgi:hypothetical protein
MCPPKIQPVQPAQTPVIQDQAPVARTASVVEAQTPDQVESSAMKVEDEDEILQRLFFKKFGCALPEIRVRSSDVDDIDLNMIDLSGNDDVHSYGNINPTVKIPRLRLLQFVVPPRKWTLLVIILECMH